MMSALLDEGVPRPLAARLRQFGVAATAFPNEWKQLSNGRLLDKIEQADFHVLITNDKNIPYQQNLSKRRIAILILAGNRLRDVLAVAENIALAILSAEPGKAYLLDETGRLPASQTDSKRT